MTRSDRKRTYSARVNPPARRAAATALLVSLACLALSQAGPATAVDRSADAGPVLHRVVWDAFKKGRYGIHLNSAHVDGSHRRRIYTTDHGFTTDLILDGRGRRVAFAPCCRDSDPALVVVPVTGGRALSPLASHPAFYAVGGIGWSPDGRRLAFEGYTERGKHLYDALWTVRLDGSGLQKILQLPAPRSRDAVFIDGLAWTSDGVLYPDDHDLRIASHGTSRLLLRHVTSVRISGDGRHIVTMHDAHQGQSLWYGKADGTHQRRLYVEPDGGTGLTLLDPVPNYDGSQILAWRSKPGPYGSVDDIVRWRVPDDVGAARVVSVADGNAWATWN